MSLDSAQPCNICHAPHDPIWTSFVASEVRRIPDGELSAEMLYVSRELADRPSERKAAIYRHRFTVLQDEARRRQRIADKGGLGFNPRTGISDARIEAVRRLDIADVIDLPIAWMAGAGRYTWYYCERHGGRERHPSLRADSETGHWWCWGCGSGGSAIDWMIARHGLGFREAVAELERRHGLTPSPARAAKVPEWSL